MNNRRLWSLHGIVWTFACAVVLIIAALVAPASTPGLPVEKSARSPAGMAATSTPYATAAAVRILEAEGNAVDAAAAACFALMVTDPAMTSLGGRTQMLIALADGRIVGIDGASQAPAYVKPLAGPNDDREGYAIVPVPGNPAALEMAVKKYGRLKWSQVLQPAIELAEDGFRVTPRIGEIWEAGRAQLGKHSGAALNYLKPDATAYSAGDTYRNPRLARVLRQLAAGGSAAFYRGPIGTVIARDVSANGGFVRERDLRSYQALPSVVNRARYRNYEIAAVGRRAWGGTLVEMLNILDHFQIGPGEPSAEEIEVLAHTMAQALEDRPQVIGTLQPKKDAIPLEVLSTREFGRQRAELIRQRIATGTAPAGSTAPETQHETTHLSVMDSRGNAVALTTSIGPRFGARVATPELGFLYAHSYRMRGDPEPLARDETEMTPTIVFRDGKPILALGAAGSERIPMAILQVLSQVLDRGRSIDAALEAPRIFCRGNRLRMDHRFSPALVEALRKRGFEIELTPHEISRHFGIVQAVVFDSPSGEFFGAADSVYDGSAAGPRVRLSR